MKKIWLLLLVFLLLLGACNSVPVLETEINSSVADVTTNMMPTAKAEWPTTAQGEIKPESDYYVNLDDWGTVPQYRPVYYDYSAWLRDLVGEEKFIEADRIYEKTHRDADGRYIETDEMGEVTFIKHCQITKEDYVAGLEAWKQHVLYLVATGFWDDVSNDIARWEFPNPDIIYTFDNEVINAYYRRKNPIEPDWAKVKTYESYSDYLAENPQ